MSPVSRAITVERDDVRLLFKEIPVDAVALGCPHCSPKNWVTLPGFLHGKTGDKTPVCLCIAGGHRCQPAKSVEIIEKSGAKVYADTCMVVSPVMEQYTGIMVNSGKALAYVPDMCGGVARIGTTEECVRVATE